MLQLQFNSNATTSQHLVVVVVVVDVEYLEAIEKIENSEKMTKS
jgi:hypothetical protein